MFQLLPARWLAALSALAALTVSAQPPTPAPAPAPVSVPPAAMAPYRSVFDSYQPFTDEKLAPWKDANDTVGKIGGWRTYAREAREAEPKNGAANPHTGHGKP